MTPISKYPIKVFFDGGCGICRRAVQKSQQVDHAGHLTFIDISAPTFDPHTYGLGGTDTRRYLHVIDAVGNTYVGVDGVMELRSAIGVSKVEAWFWRIGRCRGFHGLYAAVYALLASHRHRLSRMCRL